MLAAFSATAFLAVAGLAIAMMVKTVASCLEVARGLAVTRRECLAASRELRFTVTRIDVSPMPAVVLRPAFKQVVRVARQDFQAGLPAAA